MMYIKRHLEEEIIKSSKYYPVVMVCGQRQVGKSTMLNHIMEAGRSYVTLDDMKARRLAETDPELFFETYGLPILIDEFQRVPPILLEIKKIVDEKNRKGEANEGLFWLTGSQKFKMMQDVSESLAGRIAVYDMSGLCTAEIENRPYHLFRPDNDDIKKRLEDAKPKNVHDVFDLIYQGGMPKIVTTDIEKERYYADYVNTYLERDINVEGKNVYPVEIKKNKTPSNPDKNFYVLNKLKMDVKTGYVICLSDELLPIKRDVWLYPVKAI